VGIGEDKGYQLRHGDRYWVARTDVIESRPFEGAVSVDLSLLEVPSGAFSTRVTAQETSLGTVIWLVPTTSAPSTRRVQARQPARHPLAYVHRSTARAATSLARLDIPSPSGPSESSSTARELCAPGTRFGHAGRCEQFVKDSSSHAFSCGTRGVTPKITLALSSRSCATPHAP